MAQFRIDISVRPWQGIRSKFFGVCGTCPSALPGRASNSPRRLPRKIPHSLAAQRGLNTKINFCNLLIFLIFLMVYSLAHHLQTHYSFFNLFHYVSVRTSGALLSALFFSFLFGNWFIRTSQRKFRSKAREWTPESHQKKNDTPTMGGLFILMIFLLNTFLWNNLGNANVWIFTLCMVGFGAIGLLDDWLKIKKYKTLSI